MRSQPALVAFFPDGVAARPALVCRFREVSGAAMVALGVGLLLAKRPAI